MPIRFGSDYVGISIFKQSSTSLPVARVFDDTEAKCGERLIVRYCIWNSSVEIISCEVALLLLAGLQCQFV